MAETAVATESQEPKRDNEINKMEEAYKAIAPLTPQSYLRVLNYLVERVLEDRYIIVPRPNLKES
mgnify:CR=1 FL=1